MNIKLKSVVEWFESPQIPLWAWMIELFVFAAIRYTIEGKVYHYSYDFIVLFHAIAYYLFIFSFAFMMTKLVTGEKIEKISSAFSFFVPVILVSPFIDHYIFGRTQGYPYPTKSNWSVITLSFFQKYPTIPSHGYQVEFGIYLLLLFIYIYSKLENKRVIQKIILSLSTVFTIYVLILFLSTPDLSPIFNLLYLPFVQSVVVKDFYYWIYIFRYEVLTLLFFFIIGLVGDYKKLFHLLKDASFLRTLHFIMMYFLGFYIIQSTLEWSIIPGRINIMILIMGLFSSVLGWFFIVGINNYYDREFDFFTNTARGLPSGYYSPNELLSFSIVSGIMGAFILIPLGYFPLIFYLLFIFLGFIYSYPPLYLKQYGVKTLFIGVGSSLVFAMGYFSPLYSFNTGMNLQFWEYFILLFIIFSVGSIINDLKDFESDRISGVKTIFTWLGREGGVKITSILLFFAFILPSLICFRGLILFSILAIIASLCFWKEKVLLVYIAYFLEYLLLLIFL